MDNVPTPDRSFEDCYKELSEIVEKLRSKWTFKASVMKDFDDIKSEILTHIWKQWKLYDQSRSLGGWAAKVAKNQFSNKLRDLYTSTSRPCLKCPSSRGENLCALYGEQCVECPIYKKWYNNKRYSHYARLPGTLEDHENHVHSITDNLVDVEGAILNMHTKMKEVLTKSEWDIYFRIHIEHKTEDITAQELGFKTTEAGRKMGYKRIRQVRTLIYKKAKKILAEDGIEAFL